MIKRFRVGVTPDFGTRLPGLLEPCLEETFGKMREVDYTFLREQNESASPEQVAGCDAIATFQMRFDSNSFRGADRLAVLARWGVGYDYIDVKSCTEADVLLCITPDAVRNPVAEGSLALVLALSRKLLVKHRLVLDGKWGDKARYLGTGLAGRTVGSIGVGNIGARFFEMVRPLGFGRRLAFDPYLRAAHAEELGIELVGLETLLEESDFVCIHCPLTPETRHLINDDRLRCMKGSAFLINTARGGIVDQNALIRALEETRIAGAGLDVFEEEPLSSDSPLLRMENVILSPHAIAWTDELARGNGRGACENILTVLRGEIPRHTVNREVIDRPGFRAKLEELRNRWNRRES